MPARPWTDKELARAQKMLDAGISKYDIDRYFGRRCGSLSTAMAKRQIGEVAEPGLLRRSRKPQAVVDRP
jgi:hypothetical protein